MTDVSQSKPQDIYARLKERFDTIAPGIAVATVIAIAAQFMMEHYGAPAMLMALLLVIAFHFLAEEGRCVAGIEFSAKQILRLNS